MNETIEFKGMTYAEIMYKLEETINYFVLGKHSDIRISIPDYFIDFIITEFNRNMNIELKKSKDLKYMGIDIIPSYENKIVVFSIDSPISKEFKVIEF